LRGLGVVVRNRRCSRRRAWSVSVTAPAEFVLGEAWVLFIR